MNDAAVLADYRKYVHMFLDFLRNRDLITVPDPPGIELTAPEERAEFPLSAYSPQTRKIIVTPSLEGKPEEFRKHNPPNAKCISAHEPAHHIHRRAEDQPYKDLSYSFKWLTFPRKGPSYSFLEGFAMYMEGLLPLEQGYYHGAAQELAVLRWLLIRSARAILSVKLHTGQISVEQARDFLIEKLAFDPQHATAEAANNLQETRPHYKSS